MAELTLQIPNPKDLDLFMAIVERLGISFTVRKPMESDMEEVIEKVDLKKHYRRIVSENHEVFQKLAQ